MSKSTAARFGMTQPLPFANGPLGRAAPNFLTMQTIALVVSLLFAVLAVMPALLWF